MKLPDPVAWWNGKETAWFEHELDGYKPPPDATIPLFTEAQMREALASHEAIMRMALEALNGLFGIPEQWTGQGGGGVSVWRLGGSDQPRAAIKALKEQLK